MLEEEIVWTIRPDYILLIVHKERNAASCDFPEEKYFEKHPFWCFVLPCQDMNASSSSLKQSEV